MNLEIFLSTPVIGILRGINQESVAPLVETSISAGLKALEVTMNTPGAVKILQEMKQIAKGKISIGAGTVLTVKELEKALNAGAEFIVSPVFDKEIAAHCKRLQVPYFPGALTPQEVYDAWMGGATMVKVFPLNAFGPGYLKSLSGPFEDMRLLACGGVTTGNVGEFFKNNASGVAFGESLFKEEWIKKGEFEKIGQAIQTFLNEIPEL